MQQNSPANLSLESTIAKRPLRSKLSSLYGEIRNGMWTQANHYLVPYLIPASLQSSFKYMKTPTKKIFINKDMYLPLNAALNFVMANHLESKITSFDGCFNVRLTRGSSRMSVHSYALAIDLNAAENPLGAAPKMDPGIVKCFEDAGFVWGGRWHRPDGQHFQWVTED